MRLLDLAPYSSAPVPRVMVSVMPGDKVTIDQHSYVAAMFECASSLFLFTLVIKILFENCCKFYEHPGTYGPSLMILAHTIGC